MILNGYNDQEKVTCAKLSDSWINELFIIVYNTTITNILFFNKYLTIALY